MDMQESLDKQLDECIARALRTEVIVTPEQKARAWEELRRKAEQQKALPKVIAAPPPSPRAAFSLERLLHVLHGLLVEESAYQRARRYRVPHSHYYTLRGRFAYSGFCLSA